MIPDFLDGFEKRMEFAAVIDSIVNRRNTSEEIERLFDKHELDNILLSILTFVMETTLTEDQDCTIETITAFVREILPVYHKSFSIEQAETITRYLVKDILQNKGDRRLYTVMQYDKGMQDIPVRLIADKINSDHKIVYELTKQGYNFMFRTKEVDDELGFEIEEIKLKMLISKKNYKKAVSQSKELIRMLINKRNELQQFISQLRSSVSSISGEEYDALIREVNAMLEQEYDAMKEISAMIVLAGKRLDEEEERYGALDEKSKAAKAEIAAITANVDIALGYQRRLLTECKVLKKLYLEVLSDSIAYNKIKTFSFEEKILNRLESTEIDGFEDLEQMTNKLFNPLFLPAMNRFLNLKLIYDSQSKIKEEEENLLSEEEEVLVDTLRKENIRRKNSAHVRIVDKLLTYASQQRKDFRFSEFFEYLKSSRHFESLLEDRLLFLVMLKLYEYHLVDIARWSQEGVRAQECNGEFDLSYCLTRIEEANPYFRHISAIVLEKTEDLFEYVTDERQEDAEFTNKITMNNLTCEVRMNETSTQNL